MPEALKREVETKANALVESVLKPRHVKEPEPDPQFNYIVDIYTKWYRSYFYFCSRYACPGPYALSPFFEDKFARMEYIGSGRFNVAFMRHTGQWVEIFTDLTLDECLASGSRRSLVSPVMVKCIPGISSLTSPNIRARMAL